LIMVHAQSRVIASARLWGETAYLRNGVR
jgi:hypothetical protein